MHCRSCQIVIVFSKVETVFFKHVFNWHCTLLVTVVDFFNRINVIYGVVCEYCTEESCPVMSGGPK